jgi:hypothetical protein
MPHEHDHDDLTDADLVPDDESPGGAPEAKSDDELLLALARGEPGSPTPAPMVRTPAKPIAVERIRGVPEPVRPASRLPSPTASGTGPVPAASTLSAPIAAPGASMAAASMPGAAMASASMASAPVAAPMQVPAAMMQAVPPQIIERPTTSPAVLGLLVVNLLGLVGLFMMVSREPKLPPPADPTPAPPQAHDVLSDVIPSGAFQASLLSLAQQGWETVACVSVTLDGYPAEACTFRRPTSATPQVHLGPNRQRYDAARAAGQAGPAGAVPAAAPTVAAAVPAAAPAEAPAPAPAAAQAGGGGGGRRRGGGGGGTPSASPAPAAEAPKPEPATPTINPFGG